jgi:hypothetical protein
LCGVAFCANATPADSTVRPADNNMIEQRMISPLRGKFSGSSAVASV